MSELEQARYGDLTGPPPAPHTDHLYVSTACQHGLHGHCRERCKYCDALCLCPCHRQTEP